MSVNARIKVLLNTCIGIHIIINVCTKKIVNNLILPVLLKKYTYNSLPQLLIIRMNDLN